MLRAKQFYSFSTVPLPIRNLRRTRDAQLLRARVLRIRAAFKTFHEPHMHAFFSRLRTLAVAAALSLAPAAAHAIPVLGHDLVLTKDAEISVIFDGYSAGYWSTLSIELPDDTFLSLFTNKTASVGTTTVVGTFTAGTELVFKLDVADTKKAYFSGAAGNNPDSVVHAKVLSGTENKLSLGFEDLWGGGDKDFNDFKFSVVARPVPDQAGTAALLGLGLLALAVARRRLR